MKNAIRLIFILICLIFVANGEQKIDRSATYHGTFIKHYSKKGISVTFIDLKMNSGKIIAFPVVNQKFIPQIKTLKENQKIILKRKDSMACDCRCFDELIIK